MNIVDIIIIIPIILGFISGLFKGFIRELASLAAIVLGIYGARLFEPHMSKILLSIFDMQPSTAQPISWLVLFIIIAVVLLLLAKVLDKLFSAIALGGLNKFLGGLFGALKTALIASVLLNVFNAFDKRFSIIKEETKNESFLYKPMIKFGPDLWNEAKNRFLDSDDEEPSLQV